MASTGAIMAGFQDFGNFFLNHTSSKKSINTTPVQPVAHYGKMTAIHPNLTTFMMR
jgi:hypothetical protein